MGLQNKINVDYPPTHTFNIERMEPTKVLKKRIDLLNEHFDSFFRGERFLDIGCNKGFLSFHTSKNFKEIVGVDNSKKDIDVCNEIKEIKGIKNIDFISSSFRNFTSEKTFDRIFLGNVHHHIFREIEGHEWIAKWKDVIG